MLCLTVAEHELRTSTYSQLWRREKEEMHCFGIPGSSRSTWAQLSVQSYPWQPNDDYHLRTVRRIFREVNIFNRAFVKNRPIHSGQSVNSSFVCSAFLKLRTVKEQVGLQTQLHRAWPFLQASDKEDFSRTLSYTMEVYQHSTSELGEISKAVVTGGRTWSLSQV